LTTIRLRPIRHKLYTTFIEPKQLTQSLRNREFVFNVVLAGTGIFMLALLILLLQSFAGGNQQVISRLPVAVVGVTLVLSLRWLSRRISYYAAAYILVGFYALLAVGSVVAWGISTPFGILLLGLLIVLASTMLSSRHALYAGGIAAATVVLVQLGNQAGWIASHVPGPAVKSELGDAIGQAVVFAMLATISWLFGREMERSLVRAETAEEELAQDKATLEVRVAKRTEQLRNAQLEEMRQLYRFAEVGQLSTALLHDLANHLMVLTLEINSIQSKKQAEHLARCREAVARLNTILEEVRDRLSKGPVKQSYNLVAVIDSVVAFSAYRAKAAGVQITWDPPGKRQDFRFYGDIVKCSQVVAILVSNAIDAYAYTSATNQQPAEVQIRLESTANYARIFVTDWGVGIPPRNRRKLFKPDFSTKKHGMGIGLYLAKQMVTNEFSGRVALAPASDRTEFSVTLPKDRS
jgi:signal transduction histidine kinase